MNIKTYTVVGDDDGLFLAIPHPEHEEYIKIVRIDLKSLEVTLETRHVHAAPRHDQR